jgi:hypothetical protein
VGWTFFFLMVVLKLPIVALLYIVWWAIRNAPEPEAGGDQDGGTPRTSDPRPGPKTGPARPRGPHGEPSPPSPPRTRTPRPATTRPAPRRRVS